MGKWRELAHIVEDVQVIRVGVPTEVGFGGGAIVLLGIHGGQDVLCLSLNGVGGGCIPFQKL